MSQDGSPSDADAAGMYTTRYLVDLILDGHWSISAVTTDAIWRIHDAFGTAGRRRMYALQPLAGYATEQEVRAFEDSLLALEADLLKKDLADRERLRANGQLDLPW